METETVNVSALPTGGERVPTVTAKKVIGEAPSTGVAPPSAADQNAAEIARLATWATGDCGRPILAD